MEFILYSKGTTGGGAYVSSTAAGGATVKSTSSGGGSTQTSSSGGGSVQATTAKTFDTVVAWSGVPENAIPGSESDEGYPNYGYHLHTVSIDGDTFTHHHDVSIPNHTHSVSIPAHTHEVDIPAHTHGINIPAHKHGIEYGIFELDELPTAVEIIVDGNIVPVTSTSADLIDLIPYLDVDSSGKVTRGWHTIQIKPNKLARITAQVFSQVFLQSRGGGDY
ncbi:hypothetical protein SAFG77S_08050 [Streptomyces afghaniensis]